MTLWPGVLLCAMAALAGCGGRADWAQAGADEATVTSEYQDYLSLAGGAVKTEADIDQDILATRGDGVAVAKLVMFGLAYPFRRQRG